MNNKDRYKLRTRELQAWRGVLPPRKLRVPQKASGIIASVLAKLKPDEAVQIEAVAKIWNELVGDFLAEYSQPVRLHNGTLTVHVGQPSVMFEMERSDATTKLLPKLQSRFGTTMIKKIVFRAG